ncbi:MAG TPA: PAS domain S-box protein [Synergistales bacterium]|nr:PAS domain S-box protein [Synergistales bacterium]
MGDFLFFDLTNEPFFIAPSPRGAGVSGAHEPETARSFDELRQLLPKGAFQALLFRIPPDASLKETVSRLEEICTDVPILFLCDETQAEEASKRIGRGLHGCIDRKGLTWENLQHSIQSASALRNVLGANSRLKKELAETRLDVELHRKAYRRISEDLRSAVRTMSSLGELHRLFFHAQDEKSTLRNFCRAIVKGHGYQMAWVGRILESEEGIRIEPIAHAGDEQGFLATPFPGNIPLRGILEGHPWAVQNIREEAKRFEWAGEALQRRYRSVAVIPFFRPDRNSRMAFCVFDGREGRFSADRLAMLADLAKLLLRGLSLLEEKIQKQADDETLKLMKQAVETSVSGFVIFGLEEGIQYVNEAALRLAGYSSQEEVIGRSYRDFVLVNEKTPQILETVFRGGNWTGEFDLIRRDGSLREVFSSVSAVQREEEETRFVLVSFTDISEKRKAEQALLESRRLYEAIIEDQTDMILRFLPETLEITYANLPYARYYGKSPGELIGQSFRCRYTPEEEGRIREHLRKLTPQEPVRQIEERVIHPDGEIRWQQWIDRGIFDSEGNLVEVQGVGRDITELKIAQQNLLREKTRLMTLFDNSPDGIVFCTAEQVIESANKAFLELFGFSAPEVLGRKIDDLLHEPPDERAAALELNLASQDGRPRSLEGTRIGKNGVPVFVSVTVIPRKEPGGEISGTFAIYRDLTERRQKEQALKISSTIIEGSPVVVFRWKAEKGWPVEYVSDNIRQFGYTPEELTAPGFHYAKIIHPEDLPRVESETEALEAKGSSSFCHQYRIVMKNGEHRWVVERNRPERDSSGGLLYHFGVVIDDTERRNAEMEAKKSHEALQKSLRKLERSFLQTIEVLSSTTEARDPYTAGHQRKVALLSEALARRLGLPEKTCEGIYLAAMVHDLGKISIPAEILSKPSRLNDFEMALIRTHPESAYEILKNVEARWDLAEIVRQHHERWDGSGYPRGLRGEEILLEARILAVADVVEAIASDRPYRPGLGLKAAMAMLEESKGREFDPQVAQACLDLLREGFDFQGEIAFAPDPWGKAGTP